MKSPNPQHHTQNSSQGANWLPEMDDCAGWVKYLGNISVLVYTRLSQRKVPTEYNKQKRMASLSNVSAIYSLMQGVHHPQNYKGNPQKVSHIGSGWCEIPLEVVAIVLGVSAGTIVRQLKLVGKRFFHQIKIKKAVIKARLKSVVRIHQELGIDDIGEIANVLVKQLKWEKHVVEKISINPETLRRQVTKVTRRTNLAKVTPREIVQIGNQNQSEYSARREAQEFTQQPIPTPQELFSLMGIELDEKVSTDAKGDKSQTKKSDKVKSKPNKQAGKKPRKKPISESTAGKTGFFFIDGTFYQFVLINSILASYGGSQAEAAIRSGCSASTIQRNGSNAWRDAKGLPRLTKIRIAVRCTESRNQALHQIKFALDAGIELSQLGDLDLGESEYQVFNKLIKKSTRAANKEARANSGSDTRVKVKSRKKKVETVATKSGREGYGGGSPTKGSGIAKTKPRTKSRPKLVGYTEQFDLGGFSTDFKKLLGKFIEVDGIWYQKGTNIYHPDVDLISGRRLRAKLKKVSSTSSSNQYKVKNAPR